MKFNKESTLLEIIKEKEKLKDNEIVYVDRKEKWTPLSKTYVYEFDEEENCPYEIKNIHYFLEATLIREVIEVWHQWNEGKSISLESECSAVIYYAENDAYKTAL